MGEWFIEGHGWVMILSVLNFVLLAVVVLLTKDINRRAIKAEHVARGLQSRTISTHKHLDQVTGELQRLTGKQQQIEMEDADDYDDVDRDADTQPKPIKRKKKKRGTS